MSIELSDPTNRRESLLSFSSGSTNDPLPRPSRPADTLVARTSCCAQQTLSRSARIKCTAGVIGIMGLTGFVLSNVYDSSDNTAAKVFQPLTCFVVMFCIAVLGTPSHELQRENFCNR